MRYMMFVCTDTEPETDESQVPDIHRWVAENDAAGRRLQGMVLAPKSTATTVRVRNGEVLITDGPFAETTEALAAAQAQLASAEDRWLELEMLREEIAGS